VRTLARISRTGPTALESKTFRWGLTANVLSGVKPTLWIGGIVVAAIVVALVRLNRVDDRLAVHLVDADKKPVSASVTVWETRLYPILGSMKFLPQWARTSTRSNQVSVIDGIVKVRRVNGPGNDTLLGIRPKMVRSFAVYIIGKTNGANVYRFQERVGTITSEQTDLSVILD